MTPALAVQTAESSRSGDESHDATCVGPTVGPSPPGYPINSRFRLVFFVRALFGRDPTG